MTSTVPLGDLISTAPVERAGDTHLPVLSMTSANGLVRQDEFFKKRVASRDLTKYKVVRPGQVVVGIHVDEGAIGISRDRDVGIVSPAYALWTINRNAPVEPEYLDRFIRSPYARAYFGANYRQTASRRGKLTKDKFLELEVPLPSLEEQRRIAGILDAADALRAKRHQALAKLDTLTQSIFIDMFGDPVHRSTVVSLGEVLDVPLRNGVSPARSGTVAGMVLTLSAITGNRFNGKAVKESTFQTEHDPDKTISVDDFLICRGNGNLALVGRGQFPTGTMPRTVFPDTMIAARYDKQRIGTAYLRQVWTTRAVRDQIERSARTTNGTYKVNQSMLEAVQFPLPDLADQKRFGRADEVVAHQRLRLSDSADALDVLFASLQQRAFRGEL